MKKNTIVIIVFCFSLFGCAALKWTGESNKESTQVVKTWYERYSNSYGVYYKYYMTVDGDGTFNDNRHVIQISEDFYNKILIGDAVIVIWYKYKDGYWRVNSYYRKD